MKYMRIKLFQSVNYWANLLIDLQAINSLRWQFEIPYVSEHENAPAFEFCLYSFKNRTHSAVLDSKNICVIPVVSHVETTVSTTTKNTVAHYCQTTFNQRKLPRFNYSRQCNTNAHFLVTFCVVKPSMVLFDQRLS